MKKKVLIVLIALALCATSAFAAKGTLGIGGEGSLYFGSAGGLPMSAMLTLKLPSFPLYLGIGISTDPALALTADYWFAHGNVTGILDYYAGIGGYGFLDFNPTNLAVGGRIPLGLQLWPFGRVFEIFIEIAPAVGITLIPTAFDWHLQGALGFRFWI
ncbi:MAG TPA: hypothetical protein VHE79_11130 [Spirochaetia bacterium]